MWTQIAPNTPVRRKSPRRRLLFALGWTVIVSSLAAEVTWGWAMNRQGTEWVPHVVKVVLHAVDARSHHGSPESPFQESDRP